MKAFILAAGRGSRLAPLTDHTPKPLLPVAGKPLIHWQLERLKAAGYREVLINLHHLGDQIEASIGDGGAFGLQVTYSQEPELLETAGSMIANQTFFEGAPFLAINGDIWTDFDLSTLPEAPLGQNLAHLVLTPKPVWRTSGDFDFAEGQVYARGDTYVYCGIAVIHPDALQPYPAGKLSFQTVMFDLAPIGRLGGQVHAGEWLDIGTLEQYESVR